MPTRKTKPKPRAAERSRLNVVALTALIDESLLRSLGPVAGGAPAMLPAALGLLALVLASSSFLWLLRLRAEELP